MNWCREWGEIGHRIERLLPKGMAAQIAAVEADHDRRGHCVDLGILVLRPDAAAQYARPLGGSDYALCRR